MPIKSYLAFAQANRFSQMVTDLASCGNVTVVPAENREVAIVVTESPNPSDEKALKEKLDQVPDLQCLTLVFGHADPEPFVV